MKVDTFEDLVTTKISSEVIDYRKVHLTIMATENAALKLGVSSEDLFDRLEKFELVEKGILRFYEMLHTQSLEWVTDWLIDSLKSREDK